MNAKVSTTMTFEQTLSRLRTVGNLVEGYEGKLRWGLSAKPRRNFASALVIYKHGIDKQCERDFIRGIEAFSGVDYDTACEEFTDEMQMAIDNGDWREAKAFGLYARQCIVARDGLDLQPAPERFEGVLLSF